MIKHVQPRALAHLLDGEAHSLNELLTLVRGMAAPEDLVRVYLRKVHHSPSAAQEPFEEQIRKGLEISLLESMHGLQARGVVVIEYRRGETCFQLTPEGFESCIEGGRSRSHRGRGNSGRSGRVLTQLALMINSGEYFVRLEPRERVPRESRDESLADAPATP